MSDYNDYKDAYTSLEESKAYYRKLADWGSIPTNFVFKLALRDDRYFSSACWKACQLQRFSPIEFIDRDQVLWTTYYDDDLVFHNNGVEDYISNPFYSSGK